ncbi:hypothetical protein CLV28_0684 [Sediminihabitans luteus]|uniref:Uncharacterized protein n=1 Tax=Sediminihabitans luteus TaxID=1138585 RepID=A0A2M9D064_9CELL|nr:hypothetical protein [Sediminihabitans luteus]PJJ77465.1 hypothetical protein CLV28_0684 [Sediminihabitans luteus]GII98359.1 hypothetical protein Slu03_07370 [Sediminihabitans luteus]
MKLRKIIRRAVSRRTESVLSVLVPRVPASPSRLDLTCPTFRAVGVHEVVSPLADTTLLAEALSSGDRHDRDELRAAVRVQGGAIITGGAR